MLTELLSGFSVLFLRSFLLNVKPVRQQQSGFLGSTSLVMRQHVSCSIDYSAFKYSSIPSTKRKAQKACGKFECEALSKQNDFVPHWSANIFTNRHARASKFGCISCKIFKTVGSCTASSLRTPSRYSWRHCFACSTKEFDSESDTVYFLIDVLELVPAYKPRSSAAVLNPDYTLLHLGIQRHLCSC